MKPKELVYISVHVSVCLGEFAFLQANISVSLAHFIQCVRVHCSLDTAQNRIMVWLKIQNPQ